MFQSMSVEQYNEYMSDVQIIYCEAFWIVKKPSVQKGKTSVYMAKDLLRPFYWNYLGQI
jgi:hypothetical protein